MLSQPCPEDVSLERWERARWGVERFAEASTVQAAGLGWGFDELFAIDMPFARVDLQGAAWFIGDCTVVAVSTAAITIRTASGAIQRVYRKNEK